MPRRTQLISTLLPVFWCAVQPAHATEPPVPTPPPEPALRVHDVLAHTAAQEGRARIGESALGFTASGGLVGAGFAAQGPDMTWSHWLWVLGGVTGAASLANAFARTPIEKLAHHGAALTDEELRARWGKLSHAARIERKVGAVFGVLVGGAAIAFGVVALEDLDSDLSNDARLILGTSLVSGGALGITKGVVDWFVPSHVERGFQLVSNPRRVSFCLAPTPNGFGASMAGTF
jgi:hypothetical protein